MDLQNHVIDPTFFYDAIEEFSFDFILYVKSDKRVDEYGNVKPLFLEKQIRGSLQSQGSSFRQSKSGNEHDKQYEFYCKSLYRIDKGDILKYKDNYYLCTSVHDYDEYGVRSANLTLVSLTEQRDFADYIKYIRGEKLV